MHLLQVRLQKENGLCFHVTVLYVKLKLQHLHLPSVFLHQAGGSSCNFILTCSKFATPHVFPSNTTAVFEWWNVRKVLQKREAPAAAICSDEQHLLQRALKMVILTLCSWDSWCWLYSEWRSDCGISEADQKCRKSKQEALYTVTRWNKSAESISVPNKLFDVGFIFIFFLSLRHSYLFAFGHPQYEDGTAASKWTWLCWEAFISPVA